MEKANRRYVFPLTSLQIGDLQSYLSHRSLFLAPESKRLYILVDNRPWLEDLGLRSAYLWQLMVTKSRLSPFANTRARKERKATRELLKLRSSPRSNSSKLKKLKRWFTVIDLAALSRKRALLPVKKLSDTLTLNSKLYRTLHGFIVFEVAWTDVRGINYLNELQTDTSLAIESKCMKRWEFDSIAQAKQFVASWFPGTLQEELHLKDYLDSAVGEVFYNAEENFPRASNFDDDDDDDEASCNDDVFPEDQSDCGFCDSFSLYSTTKEIGSSVPHTPPPPDGPYKRRKVMKSHSVGVGVYPRELHTECVDLPLHSQTSYESDCDDAVEAMQYKDVLILIRFSDRDLPFELREIIMSDLRLLTLLEAGLPSWVIFLQSYPIFCHLYRPWMCPLARTLYVMVSVVTVLIGFYDLYKNVPVLKATAARVCGPLFDWIETWEMVTRIKYLGTMLFLQNFEKAVVWFLMVSRTIRSFVSVLTHPLAGPLEDLFNVVLPFWKVCIELLKSLSSMISLVIGSSFNLMEDLVGIVFCPIWFILSAFWNIAMFIIYPICQLMWEILYAPIRIIMGLVNLIVFICTSVYKLIMDLWLFGSGLIKVASTVESTASTIETSMWRSLWDDLFSHVFRAVRSILNGFVAFFTACNRHRLSIYNHSRELTHRLTRPTERLQPGASCDREQYGRTQKSTEEGSNKLKPKKKKV